MTKVGTVMCLTSGMNVFVLRSKPSLSRDFLLPALSRKPGIKPTLYAALEKDVQGGEYFGPQGFMDLKGPPGRAERTAYSEDEAVAARLWDVSEELVGERFTPLVPLADRDGSETRSRTPSSTTEPA